MKSSNGTFVADAAGLRRPEKVAVRVRDQISAKRALREAVLTLIGTQQERLEISMRRIGETFASNLDRDALLDIVVHAAKDGVGATGGRARLRGQDGTLKEVVEAGSLAQMRTALAESREMRGDRTILGFIKRTKVPELPVVIMEDFGAIVGLVVALVALVLAWQVDAVFDGSERKHYMRD